MRAAESALGVALPPTYRTFLGRLGTGSFGGEELYGIVCEDPPGTGVPDAVWITLRGRTDFRVYIGRRGKLRMQAMVDVISDSEGEVFATKRGKLRLVVGKGEALWIRGRRQTRLTQVSVKENLPMIYQELGPYWGKPLYTPCDHF